MDAFTQLTRQMAREGIRRLLVISGESDWCAAQAKVLMPDDVLWVSDNTDAPVQCSPRALTMLLGREFTHAVFDARSGFDVAAFAALSGTLSAGSWLILLTPSLNEWAQTPDADASRWSDAATPFPTPHFVTHFCRILQASPDALVWQQHAPLTIPRFAPRPAWHPVTGAPEREQATILYALSAMPPGVMVVTAARGRGKSALAGMHIARSSDAAIVTAPTRAATDVMAYYAGERFRFIAPDALAEMIRAGNAPDARWLIVDEAAAIPGPLLHELVAGFSHTLLTTTVQGYEGTGQGFLLKFCAGFPHLRHRTLNTPLRWASGCPLEKFISDALLFEDAALPPAPEGVADILPLTPASWRTAPERPAALYRLLASAHYRTSPLDLRRMMDAPGQSFWQAVVQEQPIAALWLVEEGGLTPELSRAVWAGLRRPRGNLVAQSLAAHGASPLAATLKGQRISRIAVHPYRQRQGLGERLISHIKTHARDCDYLSVSFGYTRELWRFWQRCGFQLVRLGSYREASSGCYTAMAIIPLTGSGRALVQTEQQRLARDLPLLAPWRNENLPLPVAEQTTLNDDDWLELGGFAFAHRPLSVAQGALIRLLAQTDLPLVALRAQLIAGQSESEICTRLRLAGRKALLAAQRQDVAQALLTLDRTRGENLQESIVKLQFF